MLQKRLLKVPTENKDNFIEKFGQNFVRVSNFDKVFYLTNCQLI